VIALDFVDHLAVDVFDIEVFLSHNQGAASESCVQGQTSGSHLVDTQRVVTRSLLQTVK